MATCETCKFWEGEDKTRPSFLSPDPLRVCRNPMSDWFNYTVVHGGVVRMASRTLATSTCGEHQPKVQP